jgi:pyruvate kinase
LSNVVLATHDPYYLACDATKIACLYRRLVSVVKPGQQILVANGASVLTVIGTDTMYGEVACRIENTSTLSGERWNM